jgi:DNA-binding transcriptional LysR family regulator
MSMRGKLDDLRAFATVARTRNFTRAAAELEVSTSALSHTIKRLEGQLDTRLLQRNSRSVAPTAAGEQLLHVLSAALADIDDAVEELGRQRDRVVGNVRITTAREGYDAVLRPVLETFHARHPDAVVEVMFDPKFDDIIAGRFDAGIRLGEQIEQDMIALRVGPDVKMVVVASPDYLAKRGPPEGPEDLMDHRCVGYRVRTGGPVLPWSFEQDGRKLQVKIAAALIVNEMSAAVDAAVAGWGLAYVLEASVAKHLKRGRLVHLMPQWTQSMPGFFFYYPSRRQNPPVLAALIETLRQIKSG